MSRRSAVSFGYKVGAGVGALLLASLILSGISLYALRSVVASAERTASLESAASRSQVLILVIATLALLVGFIVALLLRRVVRAQRLAQAEVNRYVAQMERANRDLEAFAGRVAHDMRGVLTPLGLLAEVLPRRAGSPESVLDDARRLKRMVKMGEAMVDGLLAFSRAGSPAKFDEVANVAEVVHEVIEQTTPLADQLSAIVRVEVPDELLVACAPALLHVAVTNVVGNALKFLAGRSERKVRIRARAIAEGCELEVCDTGPGIPKELQSRIFEPFFRVQGTIAAGTGIGLATVKRIVDAHQGKVAVESIVGQGTCLRLWFPLAKRQQLEEKRAARG